MKTAVLIIKKCGITHCRIGRYLDSYTKICYPYPIFYWEEWVPDKRQFR